MYDIDHINKESTICNPKADGSYYTKRFEEEYANMTEEEKETMNKLMKELDEILGLDDD